jgi:phenylalanyl-tRNA synthetase beta subunit
MKSVAFSLTLRADDLTLTDEHAEASVRASSRGEKKHGAVIR